MNVPQFKKNPADIIGICLLMLVLIPFQVLPVSGEVSAPGGRVQDPAVIKDISCSRQGMNDVVTVAADRPLVYSYYHLGNPDRVVVDIAQADPGTYLGPLSCGGNQILQIRVIKQELASGVLSRMELSLAEGAGFTVKPVVGDKRKFQIFVTPGTSSPVFKALSSSTRTGNSSEAPVTGSVSAAAPAEQAKGARVEPEAVASSSSVPAADQALVDIVVGDAGIDIMTTSPVKSFNTFVLQQPDRLVIDIPDIRNQLPAGRIPINAFGIDAARTGVHPGKSRVVFEGGAVAVQRMKLVAADKGLRLLPDSAAVPKKAEGRVALPTRKDAGKVTAAVEAIDFSIIDTGSRITIKAGGSCVADQPQQHKDGLTLKIRRCNLPQALQRPLDTVAFPTVVQSVTPYKVTVNRAPETRLLVKLSQDAAWSLHQEHGVINLDIIHPKPAQNEGRADLPAPRSYDPEESAPPVALTDLPAVRKDASVPSFGGKKVYTGRRVTLEFVDADIRKIFQLIAEVSKLNILIGDDVTGTITIKLVNVPWDQALDVILETKGLGMKADGNIVQIKPKSKFKSADEEALEAKKVQEKSMELQTRIFDVNYASLDDARKQFEKLGSGRVDSSILSDTRTNKIIVTDINPAIVRMKTFLESIDIPEKQVLIEARIIEASVDLNREFGIQWGVHYTGGANSAVRSLNSGFGGAVTGAPPVTGTFGPGMLTGITFGTLANSVNIDLKISALATVGLAKVVSTPKIATLNNKPAKINQGRRVPYQNSSANTGPVTEFVEAALTLEVTPHITPDGRVMMKIKATNNSVTSTGDPPQIATKEATTELLVKNGETTVIGGIYIDDDREADQGVPFLMDIPLIGWLFKSNKKSTSKSELLIFITPRILS